MLHIQPPNDFKSFIGKKPSVFLAGSIEQGKAELWQAEVVSKLMGNNLLVLNPRRDDWRKEWPPVAEHPEFRRQVEWELDAIEACDVVALYFSPGAKSPISLLEFGYIAAAAPEKLIVCCPEGFYRKGNIDICCERFGIAQVESLELLINQAIERLV